VKKYLNMGVVETMKTWSVCETIISVVALLFVVVLSLGI
jgi:GntP family gluconate:H+ symporter